VELFYLVAKQWFAISIEFDCSEKDWGITLLTRQEGEIQAVVPWAFGATSNHNQEEQQTQPSHD
jgi:hypothetical protein